MFISNVTPIWTFTPLNLHNNLPVLLYFFYQNKWAILIPANNKTNSAFLDVV